MTAASAPGKVILFGEHAVVYGRPAIAVPVGQAQVVVTVTDRQAGGVRIRSAATGYDLSLASAPGDHPLAAIIRATLGELSIPDEPALELIVESELPVGAGLGSGAAVSVAIVRALSEHLGTPLSPERQSALTFEVEKLHHGTPSGIDNTVIAYGQPVLFRRGQPVERLIVGAPFRLLIGDSGVVSATGPAVTAVRQRWQADQTRYEALFDEIGQIVEHAASAIANSAVELLGPLLDANQAALIRLGVSHPRLETLIEAARQAGAAGAKLSGAGAGGNMIALVNADTANGVERALLAAGARHVLATEVTP
jgi:mevalonate kinase